MPIATVFSRAIGNAKSYSFQEINLTPTSCSTLESAVESCLQATFQIKQSIFDRMVDGSMNSFDLVLSSSGCPRARMSSLEAAVKVSIHNSYIFKIQSIIHDKLNSSW